jgi:hypothetical protein
MRAIGVRIWKEVAVPVDEVEPLGPWKFGGELDHDPCLRSFPQSDALLAASLLRVRFPMAADGEMVKFKKPGSPPCTPG